jgi:hypothetical protein
VDWINSPMGNMILKQELKIVRTNYETVALPNNLHGLDDMIISKNRRLFDK